MQNHGQHGKTETSSFSLCQAVDLKTLFPRTFPLVSVPFDIFPKDLETEYFVHLFVCLLTYFNPISISTYTYIHTYNKSKLNFYERLQESSQIFA